MKKSVFRSAGLAGVVTLGLALTACAGAAPAATGGNDSSGTPTEVTFWGWAPGYAEAVDAYNASQSDVKVTFEEVAPGAKGGYEKMLNSVTAGNAPCLAQVGYETLTSFAAQGALEDVSEFADANKDEFTPASWSAMSIGDAVYGAPVDQGPMALFYNKEVFDGLGIAVPTTWDEYKAAGEKIHAADPSKYISSTYMDYDYAGFNWQAEAPWFGVDGGAWKVSIDSPETQKVASYWQGMVDGGLLSPAPMWDQSWYAGLGDGSIATHVGAVWIAGILKGQRRRWRRQVGRRAHAAVGSRRREGRQCRRLGHRGAQGLRHARGSLGLRALHEHGCRHLHQPRVDRRSLPGSDRAAQPAGSHRG